MKPLNPSRAKWRHYAMSNATSFTNVGELNETSLENNLIVLRRRGLNMIMIDKDLGAL